MKTSNMILIMTVAVTYNGFSKFHYDDEFNDGSVIKNYRPYLPHTITYDKERLLNNTYSFTVNQVSLNIENNDIINQHKKTIPIIRSISIRNENNYSSLLGTPLQPNPYNRFLIIKTIHEKKSILKGKVLPHVKYTIRI